ncbi:MAG: hypothetical protein QOH47_1310 [Sphingomonadales bacterium]|jgi:hypothetical protein|nr:hypothetical protein [Sphingomonadales bacterium]
MAAHINEDRIAGAALIGAALLSVLAMAHHPSSAHAGAIGGIVHGTMIVLLAITFYGFAHFALRRGVDKPAILAGLVAYAVNLFATIGAAAINGFVVTALAARGIADRDLFLLAWESNQALAGIGVFATGIAFGLWSLDFLRRPGLEAKAIGALGLLCGPGVALALASGAIDMHLAGAILAYGAFALWGVAVGQHLLRGGLGDPADA